MDIVIENRLIYYFGPWKCPGFKIYTFCQSNFSSLLYLCSKRFFFSFHSNKFTILWFHFFLLALHVNHIVIKIKIKIKKCKTHFPFSYGTASCVNSTHNKLRYLIFIPPKLISILPFLSFSEIFKRKKFL